MLKKIKKFIKCSKLVIYFKKFINLDNSFLNLYIILTIIKLSNTIKLNLNLKYINSNQNNLIIQKLLQSGLLIKQNIEMA